MPADPEGPNPWGAQGPNGGQRPSGPSRGGPWAGGPWGGGPGRGDGAGPRGQRPGPGPDPGGGPPRPDLDQLIAGAQAAIRRVLKGRGGSGRGMLLVGLAVVAVWLLSGFYRVQADEEGVVLRFGAFARRTPPGLNYHLPWPVETVLTPKVTRVNRVEIGYRSPGEAADEPAGDESPGATAGAHEVAQEALMLTGDENIVDVNVAVLWKIDDVAAYLFNTRDPRDTVKSVTESVLREVMGRTPIQPALGPLRAKIADQVMRQTQQILDSYHAGVEIVQVLPQKVDPPAAVIESFRDVQRATTDAERMRNQADSYRNDIVPRARGNAARIIALAEGDKQAAIARAQGESQRFLSVLAAYETAKDVTLKRMYIDTMQDVMSHAQSVVIGDGVRGLLPFLPLEGPARPGVAAPAVPASAPVAAAGQAGGATQ